MPERVDFHMIFDHELSDLTKMETGIIGSIGLVGLGAAIGLAPSFVGFVQKFGGTGSVQANASDIATAVCFSGALVGAMVCLAIYGISAARNRGMADIIRSRKKHEISADN